MSAGWLGIERASSVSVLEQHLMLRPADGWLVPSVALGGALVRWVSSYFIRFCRLFVCLCVVAQYFFFKKKFLWFEQKKNPQCMLIVLTGDKAFAEIPTLLALLFGVFLNKLCVLCERLF